MIADTVFIPLRYWWPSDKAKEHCENNLEV